MIGHLGGFPPEGTVSAAQPDRAVSKPPSLCRAVRHSGGGIVCPVWLWQPLGDWSGRTSKTDLGRHWWKPEAVP